MPRFSRAPGLSAQLRKAVFVGRPAGFPEHNRPGGGGVVWSTAPAPGQTAGPTLWDDTESGSIPWRRGAHRAAARVLEGDLDLPAPDEPPEDVDGIGGDVSAEECLGFEVAGGIAHQYPAYRHRRTAVVPDGGVGGDVEDLGPVSIPVGHRDRAPDGLHVVQPALEFGQPRALDGLASTFTGLALRGWAEQIGIESQTADHGHAGAHSRQKIKRGKGAVADHDDPAVGQPPANTEDGLPSPVGQRRPRRPSARTPAPPPGCRRTGGRRHRRAPVFD